MKRIFLVSLLLNLALLAGMIPARAAAILDEAPLYECSGTAEIILPMTTAGHSPLERLIHPDFEQVARHVDARSVPGGIAWSFAVDGIYGIQSDSGPVLIRRSRFVEPAWIRYRPGPGIHVTRLHAAGSFNDWRDGVTALVFNPATENYEVKLNLPRGIYEYKLVLNGHWLANPDAPDRREDLYGGYNSILACGDNPDRPRLVPVTVDRRADTIVYRFEAVDGRELQAYLQVGGELFAARSMGGQLQFQLPRDRCQGWCFLRYYDNSFGLGPPILWYESEPGGRNPMAEILYFVLVDRFRNGNPGNDRPLNHEGLPQAADWRGGDLAGLAAALADGHFQKLGATMIWLSPLVPAADGAWRDALPPHRLFSGYHGYWPTALTGVEERFGREEELRRWIGDCQRAGLRVILDVVCHHLHRTSPLFVEHPDWFIPLELSDGSRNIRRFDSHPFTTWFDEFLPTIDLSRPEPRQAVLDAARRLVEDFGADGLRLDAIKHVPPDFVRELRRKLRDRPELWLVGETLSDRPTIARLLGAELLDGQFDFPLYHALVETIARGERDMAFLLGELDRSLAEYPSGALMFNMLGNHDFCRFITLADGKIPAGNDGKELGYLDPPGPASDLAHRRLELAFAFLMTIKGIPLIYAGDEYAMSGAGDPDCRRMFCGETGATQRGRQVFDFVSRLSSLRKAHPCLYAGALVPVLAGTEHLVYARADFDERLLVVLVRELDGEVHVDIPAWFPVTDRFTDLLSGAVYGASEGYLKLPVQPATAFILKPLPRTNP